MPITFQFKFDENLIISVHKGKVPDDEFLKSYQSMIESDQFSTKLNLLVDLREADSSQRNSYTLSRLAHFMELHYPETDTKPKIAVIAPKDLSFGLARMYGVFSHSISCDYVVFRAVDAALAWLNVSDYIARQLDINSVHGNRNS